VLRHATATDWQGHLMTCSHTSDSGHLMYWVYGEAVDTGTPGTCLNGSHCFHCTLPC